MRPNNLDLTDPAGGCVDGGGAARPSPFGQKVTLNESGERTVHAPSIAETVAFIAQTHTRSEIDVSVNQPTLFLIPTF